VTGYSIKLGSGSFHIVCVGACGPLSLPQQLAAFSAAACWGGNRGVGSEMEAEINHMTRNGSRPVIADGWFRRGAISSSKNQPLLPLA